MLLARMGHRVLLVDRAAFPSDTLSSHFVQPAGVARLRRWGLLDEVLATGCPLMRWMLFDPGDGIVLQGVPPAVDGVESGCSPRRSVLDTILVRAADRAGAEVRERFTVRELVVDGGRVVGIRGGNGPSPTVEERARIVVGADGRRSVVARGVGAASYNELPALAFAYYSYWEAAPARESEFYVRHRRAVFTAVTNGGLTQVLVSGPLADLDEFRRDVAANFLSAVDMVPAVASRVRAGRHAERFYGTADLPNYYRACAGPGWALVGDAAYHKDPVTAQGMTDAFLAVERLAAALDEILRGSVSEADALASYQRWRDRRTAEMYAITCQLAGHDEIPADLMRVYRALCDNQEQCSRMFGIMAGSVRASEFFSPDNVASILAAAA